jgi:hypothetical protein
MHPDAMRIMRYEVMLRHRQYLTFYEHAFNQLASESDCVSAALSHWAMENVLSVEKSRAGKIGVICPENFKK